MKELLLTHEQLILFNFSKKRKITAQKKKDTTMNDSKSFKYEFIYQEIAWTSLNNYSLLKDQISSTQVNRKRRVSLVFQWFTPFLQNFKSKSTNKWLCSC